jgi:hypothetical protein
VFEDITLVSSRTLDATARRRSDGKQGVTINIETHKSRAGAKGNETEVPIEERIEIGAFSNPLYSVRCKFSGQPAAYK